LQKLLPESFSAPHFEQNTVFLLSVLVRTIQPYHVLKSTPSYKGILIRALRAANRSHVLPAGAVCGIWCLCVAPFD
jgi:hypothetical protein